MLHCTIRFQVTEKSNQMHERQVEISKLETNYLKSTQIMLVHGIPTKRNKQKQHNNGLIIKYV